MTISITDTISPLRREAYHQFFRALAALLIEAQAERQAQRRVLRVAKEIDPWRVAADVEDRAA